ncbi:hypothetical protein ACQPWW_26180 [Micromonospora sp. CA-240977]|uniref:hypothetical protein n=1 Tax=Micromonospora sp. CA-240977 TaxID=3239957 RepID=UPI003D935875
MTGGDDEGYHRAELRHFLVVCHEDLVEVLADDVRVELFDKSFEEVAMHALRLNLGSL